MKCICNPAFKNAYHRDCPIHSPDPKPAEPSPTSDMQRAKALEEMVQKSYRAHRGISEPKTTPEPRNILWVTPSAYGRIHAQIIQVIEMARKLWPDPFEIVIRPVNEIAELTKERDKLRASIEKMAESAGALSAEIHNLNGEISLMKLEKEMQTLANTRDIYHGQKIVQLNIAQEKENASLKAEIEGLRECILAEQQVLRDYKFYEANKIHNERNGGTK
jgi:hypothetical protein